MRSLRYLKCSKTRRNSLGQLVAATIVFCYKMCSQKTLKFQRKTSVLESVFTKTAGPQAFNFIKKKLQQRCFPGKFDKFLRIPILKNICELTAFRIN